MTVRLALGTAQFGSDYGISNQAGRPSPAEVDRILSAATAVGIDMVDTAALYDDSEAALGAAGIAERPFQVITKTPGFAGTPDPDLLTRTFRRSLQRLRLPAVFALLLHHGRDLLARGGERLIAAMRELQADGLVRRIGVSVYDPDELNAVFARFRPDMIQIPANVLDQRFVRSGLLAGFRDDGGTVCVRSAFLQGLLLMPGEELPPVQSGAVAGFQAACRDAGLAPLEAALLYVRSLEADYAVVGVNRAQELHEVARAWNREPATLPDWAALACDDPAVIDPRCWGRRSTG